MSRERESFDVFSPFSGDESSRPVRLNFLNSLLKRVHMFKKPGSVFQPTSRCLEWDEKVFLVFDFYLKIKAFVVIVVPLLLGSFCCYCAWNFFVFFVLHFTSQSHQPSCPLIKVLKMRSSKEEVSGEEESQSRKEGEETSETGETDKENDNRNDIDDIYEHDNRF